MGKETRHAERKVDPAREEKRRVAILIEGKGKREGEGGELGLGCRLFVGQLALLPLPSLPWLLQIQQYTVERRAKEGRECIHPKNDENQQRRKRRAHLFTPHLFFPSLLMPMLASNAASVSTRSASSSQS